MEADIAVMHLQAKEPHRWPANYLKLGQNHEADSSWKEPTPDDCFLSIDF